jgi:hypothetical protein
MDAKNGDEALVERQSDNKEWQPTNPRHIETIPHATVKIGSQICGVIFFRTRLLGISLQK